MWDNAPSHCSKELKEWLTEQNDERLKLYRLPPYSPELNPIEHLWAIAKKKLGNYAFKNLTELKIAVEKVLNELAQDTELIKNLVAKVLS